MGRFRGDLMGRFRPGVISWAGLGVISWAGLGVISCCRFRGDLMGRFRGDLMGRFRGDLMCRFRGDLMGRFNCIRKRKLLSSFKCFGHKAFITVLHLISNLAACNRLDKNKTVMNALWLKHLYERDNYFQLFN
jgi:hypothetical protein